METKTETIKEIERAIGWLKCREIDRADVIELLEDVIKELEKSRIA